MQTVTLKSLVLGCCLCLFGITQAQVAYFTPRLADKISKSGSNDYIRTLVSMREQADIQSLHEELYTRKGITPEQRSYEVITKLQNTANQTQGELKAILEVAKGNGQVREFTAFWAVNLFYVEGKKDFIQSLLSRSDVGYIDADGQLKLDKYDKVDDVKEVHKKAMVNGIEPGLCAIGVRQLWKLGYTGCGRKVMNIDTGVDGTHPSFSARWVGGTAGWNDPTAPITATPTDCDGHGTHTMGIMCGLDPATHDTVGVAFGANWMAAQTICTSPHTSNSLAAFQWAMNPDGNAGTVTDRPDVINCSWYDPDVTACDVTYQNMFTNVEAVGIAIVFSAGNSGSGASTITFPKSISTTLVNTFTVAAVDAYSCSVTPTIASFSSRGPSSCGGTGSYLIKPEVSAPGVSVRSAYPGGYTYLSGTSMAAPHVAGAIALLKEAFPTLTGETIKLALYNTCTDLGTAGEDNTYGKGMINVYAAYLSLKSSYGGYQHTPCDVGCSGLSYSLGCSGVITDGSGPTLNYNNYSQCKTWIAASDGPITLTFDSLDIESGYDYIYVYDGTDTTGTLLATITGSTIPAPIISSSWDMFVKFTSDYVITKKGFQAHWTAAPPKPTITGSTSTCIGTAGFLYAPTNCYSGCNYVWSTGATTNPLVVTATGNYTVTTSNTCGSSPVSNPYTFTINPLPVVSAGIDKTICNGSSTTIGGTATAGLIYAWLPTTGLSSASVANPTASPTTTTNYIVTAYNATTGCYKKDTVKVTVLASPVANAGADKTLCSGTTTTLGVAAVAGVSYSWSPSTGLSSATVSNPTFTATTAATTTYTLTATLTATGCVKTDQVVVKVNPAAVANAGVNKSVCLGYGIYIGSSAVSGTTYAWSPTTNLNNSTLAQPYYTPTAAGTFTYIVTATTSLGCSKKDTVVITALTSPVANAGLDKTICNNTSTTLGVAAVAGTTYSWSPTTGLSSSTSAVPTFTATTTGTFTYTLTSTLIATGCYKTDQVVVTVNPAAIMNAGIDQSICPGGSAVIGQALGVLGTTYTWTPSTGLSNSNSFNPTASPTVTTTYIATATTSLGCAKKDTVKITVLTAPVANAGIDRTVCAGVTTILGAAAVAGTTYAWSPTTGLNSATVSNPSLKLSTAGVYTYTLTSTLTATGCTKTDQVIVTVNALPTANAGLDKTICAGQSTTIGSAAAPSTTYLWSPVTALSSSTSATPTATPTTTTTYIVTATSSLGCAKKDTVKVTVNPLPACNAGVDKTLCSGASTTIGQTAVAFVSYAWTPSTGLSSATASLPTVSQTVTSSTTTIYTLTATTLFGCTKSDQVVVTVNPSPVANAGVDKSTCSGSGVSIGSTAISGTTYAWSPVTALSSSTSASPIASPTTTTTYTVTASALGCTKTDAVVVTAIALPTANAGVDKTIASGASTTIGTAAIGGNTYTWTPTTALNNSALAVPTASPLVTTTYTLTVTATATGCSKSDAVLVTVTPSPPSVNDDSNGNGNATLVLGTNYNVFPNPMNDVLNISSQSLINGELNIKLYNELGQVVYEKLVNVENQVLNMQIPTESLAHGIYFLNILNGEAKLSYKVVKE